MRLPELFKSKWGKLISLILIVAQLSLNLAFVNPASATTISLPESCLETEDRSQIDNIFFLLNEFKNLLNLLKTNTDLEKVRSIIEEMDQLLNTLSSIEPQDKCVDDSTKILKGSVIDKTKRINQLRIEGMDISAIFKQFNDILTKFQGQISNLIEKLNSLIEKLTVIRDLLRDLALNPILATILSPIISLLTQVIETLQSLVLETLFKIHSNLLNNLSNNQLINSMLSANQSLFGLIEEKQLRNLITNISNFCDNNQVIFKSTDSLFQIAAEGLGILPEIGKFSNEITSRTKVNTDEVLAKGDEISGDLNLTQINMNEFNTSFQNACSQTLQIKNRELGLIEEKINLEKIEQEVNDFQDAVVKDAMFNLKNQFEAQSSELQSIFSDIELFISSADITNNEINFKISKVRKNISTIQNTINTMTNTMNSLDELGVKLAEFIDISNFLTSVLEETTNETESILSLLESLQEPTGLEQ